MKVIDIHTHIALHKLYPKDYLLGMFDEQTLESQKLEKILKLLLRDKEGVIHKKRMLEAGIVKSVLLIIDSEMCFPSFDLKLEDIFSLHNEIRKNSEGVFEVFAGLDPRRKGAFDLFKKSVFEFGFKGLKLYPPMGFCISAPELEPFWGFCADYKLPVLIHTGPSVKVMHNEYGDLIRMYETLKRHENVSFILAHTGWKLKNEELKIFLELKNVYYDVSGFQKWHEDIASFPFIYEEPFVDKVLFGSDWPLFHAVNTIKRDIDWIKGMGTSVNNEAFNKVFYSNANRLLNE